MASDDPEDQVEKEPAPSDTPDVVDADDGGQVAYCALLLFASFFEHQDVYDGELEAPPTMTIFGIVMSSPAETRASRRQRCARNYVRKLFRGRAWLRTQLEIEQEKINLRNSNVWTLMFSRLLGLDTRVHPHLPYERAGCVRRFVFASTNHVMHGADHGRRGPRVHVAGTAGRGRRPWRARRGAPVRAGLCVRRQQDLW